MISRCCSDHLCPAVFSPLLSLILSVSSSLSLCFFLQYYFLFKPYFISNWDISWSLVKAVPLHFLCHCTSCSVSEPSLSSRLLRPVALWNRGFLKMYFYSYSGTHLYRLITWLMQVVQTNDSLAFRFLNQGRTLHIFSCNPSLPPKEINAEEKYVMCIYK